jgi:hypothetical protein
LRSGRYSNTVLWSEQALTAEMKKGNGGGQH